jgi:hypothetical protein
MHGSYSYRRAPVRRTRSRPEGANRAGRVAHEHGRKVGLCGQAPSDHPPFAAFLPSLGIDSISVTPDALADVVRTLAVERSARASTSRSTGPHRLPHPRADEEQRQPGHPVSSVLGRAPELHASKIMMRRSPWFVPALLVALLPSTGAHPQRAEAQRSSLPPRSVPTAAPADLSAAEIATLRFMREEEKLAHDVYAALAAKGVAFARIQQAERRHFEVIGWQLERFGVPDPAAGKRAGELQDPSLRSLYAELVERGSRGPRDALTVGLEIEERDIVDLERAIQQTSRPELRRVYSNLQRASRNHLREFHRELTALGGSYTPKYLDRPTFDRIANEPIEPGGMMGMVPCPGMEANRGRAPRGPMER